MNYDETKDELTNLRAAVRGRADWVFATDDPRVALVLARHASDLFAAGVSPAECGCGYLAVTDTGTGVSWRVAWVTVPKVYLAAADLAGAFAAAGWRAAEVTADTDLVPLSPTPAGVGRVAEFLVGAGSGRVRMGAADVRAN